MRTKLALFCLSLSLLQSGIVFGEDEKVLSTIIIPNKGAVEVFFPHGKHQAVAVSCIPCHDIIPKESQAIKKMKAKGSLKKKDVMSMCQGCHRTMASKGEKTGPTDCKGCHVETNR